MLQCCNHPLCGKGNNIILQYRNTPLKLKVTPLTYNTVTLHRNSHQRIGVPLHGTVSTAGLQHLLANWRWRRAALCCRALQHCSTTRKVPAALYCRALAHGTQGICSTAALYCRTTALQRYTQGTYSSAALQARYLQHCSITSKVRAALQHYDQGSCSTAALHAWCLQHYGRYLRGAA